MFLDKGMTPPESIGGKPADLGCLRTERRFHPLNFTWEIKLIALFSDISHASGYLW